MSVECALSSPVRHIDMKNTDIDKVILEKIDIDIGMYLKSGNLRTR